MAGGRDGKYFNCSEDHELDRVARHYADHKEVKEFVRKKCKDGTIKYWTNEKLYAFLDENGFTRA